MNNTVEIQDQKKARIPLSTAITIIAFFCALLMWYTAFSKLFAYGKFHEQLLNNPVIYIGARFLAWAVPIVEMIIGALLLFEKTRKLGLTLFAGIMTVFTIYIIFLLKISPVIPCSCTGLEGLTWAQHFWFNIFFILLAIVGLRLMKKRKA